MVGGCLPHLATKIGNSGELGRPSILSGSSSKANASRDHFFVLSLDFHELWHSMTSICLFIEVKWQWAT